MSERPSYIVVADYNLTRVDDVRLITRYAAERYGCRSILIRSKPTAVDREVADVVFDVDPLDPRFVSASLQHLAPYAGQIRAVLPFSDNSVKSGAALAAALGLAHDDVELALAAFSKEEYRKQEWGARALLQAQRLMVPRSRSIQDLAGLRQWAAELGSEFVLKPSCEGNNRGVIKLGPKDDLERAFAEVEPYIGGGLIVEELIPYREEYSFDGVGHLSFVTKKSSATGRYPVERGQTVPARDRSAVVAAVRRGGTVANLLCGQHMGPFHHEVKVDPDSAAAAVVEPNRRPAGMRIWHLAERVYGLNFFRCWVDQLLTGELPAVLPAPRGVASIRMLPAPKAGVLRYEGDRATFGQEMQRQLMAEWKAHSGSAQFPVEFFGFQFNAASGTTTLPEPMDNSHFPAQICLFSPDSNLDEHGVFELLEQCWAKVIAGFIHESR
jgi:hypothetical protein